MNFRPMLLFITSIIVFEGSIIFAQSDSIITKNGQEIIGELKNLKRGVATIETDYSDSDFKIEWLKVKELHTDRDFVIFVEDGERLIGNIQSAGDSVLISTDTADVYVKIAYLVAIQPLDKNFIDKLSASIDFGLNLSKANNLKQVSLRSNLGYVEQDWSTSASLDNVSSSQDDVESTKRSDIIGSFNYFLGKGWFSTASLGYLQNTEQKLESRITPSIGAGNYIIQTNSAYLGFGSGIAFNSEKFSDEVTPDRSSGEFFLSAEWNLFDVGDLSLLTNIVGFKNLDQADRYRADFKFDIKYDLPLDFYIRLGYTFNYDSHPAAEASETDYVLQAAFGWEL